MGRRPTAADTHSVLPESGEDAAETLGTALRRRLFTIKSMVAIWIVLTSVWTSCVVFDFCERVREQTDMSRAVEEDLDSGGCAQQDCAPQPQRWWDVASTYLKFGGEEMAEWAVAPPAILLIAGGCLFMFCRRSGAR